MHKDTERCREAQRGTEESIDELSVAHPFLPSSVLNMKWFLGFLKILHYGSLEFLGLFMDLTIS